MIGYILYNILLVGVFGLASTVLVMVFTKIDYKKQTWRFALTVAGLACVSVYGVHQYKITSCGWAAEEYEAADSKFSIPRGGVCLLKDPSNGKWVTINNYGRSN